MYRVSQIRCDLRVNSNTIEDGKLINTTKFVLSYEMTFIFYLNGEFWFIKRCIRNDLFPVRYRGMSSKSGTDTISSCLQTDVAGTAELAAAAATSRPRIIKSGTRPDKWVRPDASPEINSPGRRGGGGAASLRFNQQYGLSACHQSSGLFGAAE